MSGSPGMPSSPTVGGSTTTSSSNPQVVSTTPAPTNAWQGFVAWWNNAGLAWKFGVAFGGLVVVVIILAIIKLIYDKLTLKRNIKREKIAEAERAERERYEDINMKKRYSQMEEGELFGVRAIQSGFYGGVAQSAPNSPMGSRAASRAGSLYNQPTSPSGPLNGSTSHLLSNQRSASPMGGPLPLTRSPLGLNPAADNGPRSPNSLPSPLPNAMIRDPQRPGTASSNRGFETSQFPSPPPHERHNSDKTINLDNVAPAKSQPNGVSLRPSASDASTTSPPSTNHGTSRGSRGSSFTSTYSFDAGEEQQPHKPMIVKPLETLPSLPILQPLTAEIHSGNSRGSSPAMSPAPQQNISSPPPLQSAELPSNTRRSPPRDMNFSTPFRRKSQPEQPPSNPEFGPLPAAAMNGGPQQFGFPRTQSPAPMRTQSPGPMNMGPPPRRTDSPGPRTMSPGPRTMSPGPRQMGAPPPRSASTPTGNRPGGDYFSQQRRGPPAPLDLANKQPSFPSFTQQGQQQQDMFGPKTAPLHPTTSSSLAPPGSKTNNRLTADILGDFYDSYSYERNQRQLQMQQQQRQGENNGNGSGFGFPQPPSNQGQGQSFEMNRMQQQQRPQQRQPTIPRLDGGGYSSLPGSPRMQQQQAFRQGPPTDRRLI